MKVGYARVSTHDQNLDLQIDALTKAGCEKIFTDKISSAKVKREGLESALEYVRSGDMLVVWKLDRLCRNIYELMQVSKSLEERGIELQSLTESIDTSTPTGRMYFTILGAVAQMEREQIQERVRAGLAAAKLRGKKGGRPKALTSTKKSAALEMLKNGMDYNSVAEVVGVTTKTLYRHLPATKVNLLTLPTKEEYNVTEQS